MRRHRMGYIKLAAPVAHVWYLKGIPSYMAILLDMPLRDVEQIVYFNSYVVLNAGNAENLSYKQLLTEDQWIEIEDQLYSEDSQLTGIEVGIGAEALQQLLQDLDLEKEAEQLREEIANSKGQKRAKLIKRLRVIDNFIATQSKPEWMILSVIPVIPPDLRPMVQLDGGRFATSDLKRSVSPGDQPEQPSRPSARNPRAGNHCPEREADVARSSGCPDRQRTTRTDCGGRKQSSPEVSLGHY